MRFFTWLVLAANSLAAASVDSAGFETKVRPVLVSRCSGCHNASLRSGDLNLAPYLDAATVSSERPTWEKILRKIEAGEMPPKGAARPSQAQIADLTAFLHSEFARADAAIKPDPGRVVARRLNRTEYRNSIRDLLTIDFRADRDFPTDDSGYGFDNIGDILTVSPVLMQKYLEAAESIASAALGADPLPAKPIEATYEVKFNNLRRLDYDTVEARHRVDYDGEYIVRFGFPGTRGADAKAVDMAFSMDGQVLGTMEIETKPSKLVYFDPFSDGEMHLYLPAGDHVFRAAFQDDDFAKTLTSDKDAYSAKKNKYIGSITFVGPFPSKIEKASRKRVLICDPASGQDCIQRILSTVAHRAWRRPVSAAEVAGLAKFVSMAKAEGKSAEQGIQLALEAVLVSPDFLFRIEHDPNPTDPGQIHRLTDVELASRLSYFLWSSMPDDELLTVAESKRLHEPAVLDAQVKRMLADPKAQALCANFAGQWLEIRNLDSIAPDPKLFPEWTTGLKNDLRTETEMFFQYVLRENRPISEFLDARYTFVNGPLAKFYGIEGVKGADFRKVDLTSGQRGGVVTQAAVLAVSNSYPNRTSPTLRGKFILDNILGTPPPPAPPDVPALDVSPIGTGVSMRKQLEQHRSDPYCASCHNQMDTLGFGLENYNAIGKWRTMDGWFKVDPAGTMPDGKSFQSPAEMRAVLLDSLPLFSRCLIEKMTTYALGRGMQPFDSPALDGVGRALAANGYRFQTMIYEIVRSLPFQSRRGEESQHDITATAPADAKEKAHR
ncbi:MAG TPA: DUF1592 domain-containing protein [Candidatus Acidoferrales bacterium]|nr:DUF1592 domain-containing protein [Candidatus Acidoferrales bacterium]